MFSYHYDGWAQANPAENERDTPTVATVTAACGAIADQLLADADGSCSAVDRELLLLADVLSAAGVGVAAVLPSAAVAWLEAAGAL